MRIASIAALLLAIACEHVDSGVARGQATADTVGAVWLARAQAKPEIAGWLYLRAAAATPDSVARSALYARVDIPLARERIPWVEAGAREHFGDTLGALKAYRALPVPVTVFRLRATLGLASRDSVRTGLLAFIVSSSIGESVRVGTALFDKLFTDPTAVEQLAIARSAARVGSWTRARAGFQASRQSDLSTHDRFTLAMSLARTDAAKQAADVFATVDSPASLALAARYQGALALLNSGDGAGARAALRALGQTGSDTSAAAALSLLADLQTDDGDDAASRQTLLSLIGRFPSTRFAAPAKFNAAIIALILGQTSAAAKELAALASSSPGDALGASYWLGRARESGGDKPGARRAWLDVLRRDSTSYYAALAAARLGVKSMHSSTVTTKIPPVPSVDSALLRVSLLRELGMSSEAQMENDRLYRTATADSSRLLATASAFSGTDQAARAIALGREALARFGSTADVWRLIYPVAARDTIVSESRKAGMDPVLVAALIRQESNFNPRATSPAGARGLMQVMPAVGQSIAPAAGITSWNPALLYDAGINIEIGIRHLAPLLRGQPNLPRSLAAYNAGGSRVARWSAKRGADDAEIFTERIPFSETRDYVKSVLRNREFYQALYSW
ncbi:MAG: lytic transglycosylase domain-containing protein [Gemmatimonadaceae bacterium]